MRIAPGPWQGFNDASAILPTISVALISIIDAHHLENRLKPFFFPPFIPDSLTLVGRHRFPVEII